MCDRSSLYLIEAKLITIDLLKRSLELFDLYFHYIEYVRLVKYFSEREQNHDHSYFSSYKPCKLNSNIISDIDTYLHHLYASCRFIKSNLRSLHASRMVSPNDYTVIDDEIYTLIKHFRQKINQHLYQHQSMTKEENNEITFEQVDQSDSQMYKSQKHIEESHLILILFGKIAQLFQLIFDELFGVHTIRDSHILQPIVINIIRLLLSIANKLKQFIKVNSTETTHLNNFRVKPSHAVCTINNRQTLRTKSKFKIIEIHPNNINLTTKIKSQND